MKICPVCQYEEDQDSETSCAICGSDLESSVSTQAPTETESVAETPETKDEEGITKIN